MHIIEYNALTALLSDIFLFQELTGQWHTNEIDDYNKKRSKATQILSNYMYKNSFHAKA